MSSVCCNCHPLISVPPNNNDSLKNVNKYHESQETGCDAGGDGVTLQFMNSESRSSLDPISGSARLYRVYRSCDG